MPARTKNGGRHAHPIPLFEFAAPPVHEGDKKSYQKSVILCRTINILLFRKSDAILAFSGKMN
jgi:hypothetical protein